jgi:PAS domain S-box-containing protein
LMGKSSDEVLGKTDVEFHADPRLGEAAMENDRIARETRKPLTIEELAQRQDGSLGTYLTTKVPWISEDGTLLGTLGVSVDITERKRMEESLKEAHDNLEELVKERTAELEKAYNSLTESEEKYRNIVETANEGIWVNNTQSIITYVNEKMAEMLGYSREELIGKSGMDFTDEEGKALAKLNVERRQYGVDETHEFKLIRKDGSPLFALVSSKALFDDGDKFVGSLHLLTDITDRK